MIVSSAKCNIHQVPIIIICIMLSSKLALGQQSTSKQLETMIWSCDTGQQIPGFDRYQLPTTRKSNIKEVVISKKDMYKMYLEKFFAYEG